MPGVNRTGLPNTQDIWLGRGAVYFGTLNATTGKPEHFRHLGNCKQISGNQETETLDHNSSRSGIKVVNRQIVLSQKLNLTVVLDEINFDNLALAFSGEALKDQANAARSGNTTNKLLHADAKKGFSYELRDASEARLYDINLGSLVVKSHSGSDPTAGGVATLVEGTDYTVDTIFGTVFLLSTGSTHVDGYSLWFSYTSAGSEKLVDQVKMMNKSKISGFLRYVGINPANADKKMLVDFHSVSLKPEGDINFISDEFMELTLSGVAESNELGYPNSPIGNIFYHGDA